MVATLVTLLLAVQVPEAKAQGNGAATPEQAVRAFIVAIMTRDKSAIQAVSLPSDDLDLLLQAKAVEPDAVEQLKANIAKLPIKLLKEGEEVTLIGGRKFKAKGVTPDHAIALPGSANYPVEVWKKGLGWRVDASPVIAGMKQAAPKSVDPAKLEGKITINVEQKLDIQFSLEGDAISEPRIVNIPKPGSSTVHVEFTRMNGNLSLTTKNPFSKSLSFRALARNKGGKTYYETSIAPVNAGIFGLELWGDPIEELILFDFKLLADRP
jgi:hypothetical protein